MIATVGTCALGLAGAVAGWLLFSEPESDAREVAGLLPVRSRSRRRWPGEAAWPPR